MLTRHRGLNPLNKIQHSITPTSDGVLLRIWETSGVGGSGDRSFLFKLNQRLASQEDAQRILRSYLDSSAS